MEKITTENISGGVKLAVAAFTLFMTFASGYASYKMMDYRVLQLEKVQDIRNEDHEKIIQIESDVANIKEKTDAIYNRVVLGIGVNSPNN